MNTVVAGVNDRPSLSSAQMPRTVPICIGLASVAAATLLTVALSGFRWGWVFILSGLIYLAAIAIVARIVEDRRQSTDRVVRTVITFAFIGVLVPLASVFWTVITKGISRFDATFLSETMRMSPESMLAQLDGGVAGGAYHAMVGTLIVTGVAGMIAVPIGILTAIYLVEFGSGRLASTVTRMVDVMTGIPSIVAGLFAYALFELFLGPGTRSGLSGGVALSLLMAPVVIRSSEEMLRLVPNELREASYALGVPKWKTILKVVLPTAIAGILTGVTLSVARVIGETAPLLVTVGLAQDTNYNPLDGRMTTLPVYTYYQYVQPGLPTEVGHARAWAAAMMLVIIVAALFTLARILAWALKPKGL